jgi:hypothetical protein
MSELLTKRLIATMALAVVGTPGFAQSDQRLDPTGILSACTPALTVQKNGCVVETLYSCDGSSGAASLILHHEDGGYGSIEGYPEDGLLAYTGPLDGSYWFQMLETFDGLDQDALRADGIDTFRQELSFQAAGSPPQVAVFEGTMFLIGETVEFSGIEFDVGRTDYSFVMGDEEGTVRHLSTFYLNPDYPFILTGNNEQIAGGETTVTDHTPVQISRAGEPGFESRSPLFDCGELG